MKYSKQELLQDIEARFIYHLVEEIIKKSEPLLMM
jgi:hypothetical protein